MSQRSRDRLTSCLLLVALTGCGGSAGARIAGVSPAPSSAAEPSTVPSAPSSASAAPTSAGSQPGAAGGRPQGGGVAATRPPSSGSQPGGAAGGTSGGNPDDGGLGSMSRAFLRPAPYSRIALEIASAAGAAPSAGVEDNLAGNLAKYSGKTVRHADHTFSGKGSNGCWNDADIARVTGQERQVHTGGAEAALFMGFLDGSYCDNINILGLAYGASAVVVFKDQVKGTATIPADTFLKSVTLHEVGHILGLVGIGYRSPVAHEDSAHPHHSSDSNSAMYWAIEQGNLLQQFVSGPPLTFDSADETDLAGLRDGTL